MSVFVLDVMERMPPAAFAAFTMSDLWMVATLTLPKIDQSGRRVGAEAVTGHCLVRVFA